MENFESLRLTFAIIISFTFITISINKLFKVGFVSIIFILYCISQIIGLFENNEKIFNLENWYLIILSLGSLRVIFYISQSKENKNSKNFLFITISVFLIVSILLLYSVYQSHGLNSLYIYTLIPLDENIANSINLSYPRITGITRNLSIANILIIILLLQKKIPLQKKLLYF